VPESSKGVKSVQVSVEIVPLIDVHVYSISQYDYEAVYAVMGFFRELVVVEPVSAYLL